MLAHQHSSATCQCIRPEYLAHCFTFPPCRLSQAQQALAAADADKGSLQQQVVRLQQQLAAAHTKAAKAGWATDAAAAEKAQQAAGLAGSSSTRQQLQVRLLAVIPPAAACLPRLPYALHASFIELLHLPS
jgi:hypothetical protein